MNDPPESKAGLQPTPPLLDELRGLIQGARERVARTVNRELVLLYWRYGNDSPENGPDLNWLLGRERAGEQSHSPVVVVSGPY